jgi:hypothetical protein
MLQTSLRGGVAGAVATVVMTLEQPLDKRLFDSKYDDVGILGLPHHAPPVPRVRSRSHRGA